MIRQELVRRGLVAKLLGLRKRRLRHCFDPYEIDAGSVPDELTFIQRGKDPAHYEIVPRPGANLTPEQYVCALAMLRCK